MGAGDAPPPVRVDVLGPLRLVVGTTAVDVPGPKRRAVLALLALAEGRTVTIDHLVDALWPAEVPESGRQALHTHISRLRAHLGNAAARLQTRQDGYQLDLLADGLDVAHARSLVERARAVACDDAAGACALLREAHALWRGPVLSDLTDIAPIATAVEGCAQLYREVTDALLACAIDAGQGHGVLALATTAHADDPLREPAVLLLMRALATTGQAPEALRTGREYRHRLAEEAGLDPSPALGELERVIAAGAAGPARTPSRRSGAPVPARPASRLIGREVEVSDLHRLLTAERLVTLVGPGGVGKTRVADEVARRCEAATILLLAPVTDPAAIPHALAAALNLTVVQGDVLAACVAVLSDRRGPLVIDNCEHLLDAVRDTVEVVLAGCPDLSVLTTSRERLGLPAEYAFRLAPLPLPGPDGDLPQVPSVAVFLDRAGRVRPGPPPTPAELRTVADIVRRLDGMPLAIELAAGRLSTFSLADLHHRLDRSLDLLGGGRPSADARHRTLRATIEWSYQLLSEDERRLFRHLAVFVDGVDVDAAERLAADLGVDGDPGSALARLVDTSMIEADVTGRTRYRMLETLRAFGLDRLAAAGEDETATASLIRWAVELTAWIAATMTTEREPEADAALRHELPNLRAAWRLVRDRGSLDDAAALVTALFDAVTYRDLVEIRGWAEELAEDPALTTHPRAGAVLGTAAEAAYHRGDYPRAERLACAGLERATENSDTWYCLLPLSVAALARGSYDEVIEHSLASAAITTAPRESLGIAALAAAYAGDPDRARTLNDQGLDGAVSPTMLAWGAYVVGEIESSSGRRESAEQHYLRAIDLARTSGATFLVGVATVGLLTVRADAGRVDDALRGYRDVIGYFARTSNWTHLWTTLRNLADLLRRLGDDGPATLIATAADNAPDAPAVGHSRAPEPPAALAPGAPRPSRADVLEVARRAIERNLKRP
ncbi:BTAD domain-containing putative transcriptional regulator [Pseudonocardia alaniniphila]|uniref:Winged helix-turn-helix domain-containing protein n=1 Tax=Pseudonocardia alaniniphila TaxID=75291 RepID=A0ABS9T908_9PSEU|nr:BTAD domain-containing putative transcriptional regulator [Pseudonocardia alaniniphila]MCH6165020.1 winged helix-turn-helix domain-containing protein [Pseudonocardia alaniniphila]